MDNSETPPKSTDVERYLDDLCLRRLEEDRAIFDMEGHGEREMYNHWEHRVRFGEGSDDE